MKDKLSAKKMSTIFRKAKEHVANAGLKASASGTLLGLAIVILSGTFEPFWWDQAEMPDALRQKLK